MRTHISSTAIEGLAPLAVALAENLVARGKEDLSEAAVKDTKAAV